MTVRRVRRMRMPPGAGAFLFPRIAATGESRPPSRPQAPASGAEHNDSQYRPARASMPCTNRAEDFAPVRDSISPAQRCIGIAWATIKKHATRLEIRPVGHPAR